MEFPVTFTWGKVVDLMSFSIGFDFVCQQFEGLKKDWLYLGAKLPYRRHTHMNLCTGFY